MEASPRDGRHGGEAGPPAGHAHDDADGPGDGDDGPADHPAADGLAAVDPLVADVLAADPLALTAAPDEHELRPQRRLRGWQIAPMVVLGVFGSLMFAFPLAFEFGDGGPMVAMLGLLICAATAGWAIMVARRIGYVWPGLPERGSGQRPDWRFVAGYVGLGLVAAAIAVIRLARLR
jgi:hypothetical protein